MAVKFCDDYLFDRVFLSYMRKSFILCAMKRFFVISFLVLFACSVTRAWAGMSSTHYLINWDSMNSGGSDVSTSANFGLRDTVGDVGSGTGTSANYQLSAGYRVGEAGESLSLLTRCQEPVTQAAYVALNILGKTVTLSAATTTFASGDYIAVVENKGFLQMVAVGKVSNVVGAVLSVDQFDGATGMMNAVPGGGDDFVYRLNGASLAFGTVIDGVENTSVSLTSVQSTVATGYSVYVQADRILQNGSAQTIATVVGGHVLVGTEAYGASVTGTRAVSPDIDTGVTTAQRSIQTSPAPSTGAGDRVAMSYKLSVVSSTNPGAYSQNVYYTLTANY